MHLNRYSNSGDPVVEELVRQVGLGNATANLELQQVIADDHLSGCKQRDQLCPETEPLSYMSPHV